MSQNKRYVVTIQFNWQGLDSPADMVEPCKTMKEAKDWGCVVDESVKRAFITDTVTGKQTVLK